MVNRCINVHRYEGVDTILFAATDTLDKPDVEDTLLGLGIVAVSPDNSRARVFPPLSHEGMQHLLDATSQAYPGDFHMLTDRREEYWGQSYVPSSHL